MLALLWWALLNWLGKITCERRKGKKPEREKKKDKTSRFLFAALLLFSTEKGAHSKGRKEKLREERKDNFFRKSWVV